MASTPITSIFDAAKWFLTIAEDEGSYLSPLKLNCLLYLSQAYYAAAKPGMKLMPAHFVAHDLGPVDPNLYRVMEQRNLNIFYEKITGEALLLVKGIWKKYGKISSDDLVNLLKSHLPYRKSYSVKIRNNEIPLSLMAGFYGARKNSEKRKKVNDNIAKGDDKQNGSRKNLLRRSQNGIIEVKKWAPKKEGDKNG